MINLGPYRLNPTGPFNPTKQYEVFDIVEYKGSSYICINNDIIDGVSNIGVLPVGEDKSNKYYYLLAGKGDKGDIAPRYDSFTTLESNIWDYAVSDKVIIKADAVFDKPLTITNTYDGCCGMIITTNQDVVLPDNSNYSVDFGYTNITNSNQYYTYTFICVGEGENAKLLWNRSIQENMGLTTSIGNNELFTNLVGIKNSIDELRESVRLLQVQVAANTSNIEANKIALDGKANTSDLDFVVDSGGATVDAINVINTKINTLSTTLQNNIGENTKAIATKANQTDLDETNANVTANTEAIKTKANQSALDTTNANVANNALILRNKANQTALDAANSNITANATAIQANVKALTTKADKSALDTTNANVAANTKSINSMATQSTIDNLSNNVTAISEAMTTKADKSALDTTNANVAANTETIKTKVDTTTYDEAIKSLTNKISSNVTAIAAKANQSALNAANTTITNLSNTVSELSNAVLYYEEVEE